MEQNLERTEGAFLQKHWDDTGSSQVLRVDMRSPTDTAGRDGVSARAVGKRADRAANVRVHKAFLRRSDVVSHVL